MSNRILVLYGSYRSGRMGIRLAEFVVARLRRRGDAAELIDAKAINLPMLDRMYKEYPKGQAPAPLEDLAQKIRGAEWIRLRYRRIQLGRPAWTEEPHGPFSGRMVLATCRDRELFGRPSIRRAGGDRLARHTV